MVSGPRRRAEVPLDRGGRRRVGERQALGGEADPGRSHIGDRTQIAADTEPVRHTGIRPDRQMVAAVRRRGAGPDVDDIATRSDDVPQDLIDHRDSAVLGPDAEHLGTLQRLAATAEHRQCGVPRVRGQQGGDLTGDDVVQLTRRVERREHGILPDQQAQFGAAVVERGLLVHHAADHPDHVGTALGEL